MKRALIVICFLLLAFSLIFFCGCDKKQLTSVNNNSTVGTLSLADRSDSKPFGTDNIEPSTEESDFQGDSSEAVRKEEQYDETLGSNVSETHSSADGSQPVTENKKESTAAVTVPQTTEDEDSVILPFVPA